MNTVEPIRNKNDLKKIELYLAEKSKRDIFYIHQRRLFYLKQTE